MPCLYIPPSWVVAFVTFLGQADGAANGEGAESFKGNTTEEALYGGGKGGMSQFLLMIGLLIFIFYFLMIRPERKRMKERDAMLGKLQKGDTVVTTAGIVGKIFRVEEKEVIINIDNDNNVKMRFLRSAVNEIVQDKKAVEKTT